MWHNLSLTSVERAKKTTQAFFIAVAISLFFMYPVNIAVAAVADEAVRVAGHASHAGLEPATGQPDGLWLPLPPSGRSAEEPSQRRGFAPRVRT